MRNAVRLVALATLILPGVAGAQLDPACPVRADARNTRLIAPALAVVLPQASVTVDGQCFDLSELIRPEGKLHRLQFEGRQFGSTLVSLDLTMDPDPSIGFAIGTTNLGALPVTFGFSFITPVVGATYVTARSRLAVTVTDDVSLGGASVGSVLGAPLLDGLGGLAFVSLGVPRGIMPTNGPVPCVVGAGVGVTACNYGLVTAPIAPTAFTFLRADVAYTLSPGDFASTSGAVDIFAAVVPEPASTALLGTGLLAIAGLVARRRRG